MDPEVLKKYVEKVEKRIEPKKVAVAFQGAEMLRKLPLFLQRRIIGHATQKDPYMGFVVEPWSLFLSFHIEQKDVADFLPPHYELLPTSLFQESNKTPAAVIGLFNVHTDVFWGSRFELYVIAKNKETNLASWIIYDYDSNTINYEPGKGFLSPTLEKSVFTTTHNGLILTDFESKKGTNRLSLTVDINQSHRKMLDRQLWIEGNLSIDYSGKLGDGTTSPFGLIFDPDELKYGLNIEKSQVNIKTLDFGFLKDPGALQEACCFPYAQHFISTTIPKGHEMKSESDLVRKIEYIAREI